MILTIDIGNSSIVTGIFRENELETLFRMAKATEKTSDEYGMLLYSFFQHRDYSFSEVEGVILSSVVPSMMHRFKRMCRDYFNVEPVIIGPGVKTGLNILYEDPKEVGSDRIANAVAALSMYQAPCIVVDIGTATTFCYIDEKHRYRGGVIAPGPALSVDALSQNASRLPRVELQKPERVINKTTLSSIHSGTYYGYLCLIDGMIERMKKEVSQPHAVVIATGGLVHLYAEDSKQIQYVDQNLTHKGLKQIYDRNK
ncbi:MULTISPECIES: type III pantothenate kinase [Shouchella]|uniref:Type III pantothenate kinase n=3 Tax=Bacillaceae TaxID=186817 RepID=A0A060M7U5_9BACI|nr:MULTISPECIES: type III pantothenate kinase [Bacillaceae]RQW18116.1 type III pantothenate kinase [Bacillus sp. C1-1]AIC96628.1 Type III pantothenate kinase [Shouchella lehensis G1]KQL51651.1 type III pantothenate kinase [Alkalicoccobacillus plakortidis]MBG9782369.1 pantothenate kinase [Shouchella lehensis]TES46894.1 type III pantothenate kinase [Shouchella lehensis]